MRFFLPRYSKKNGQKPLKIFLSYCFANPAKVSPPGASQNISGSREPDGLLTSAVNNIKKLLHPGHNRFKKLFAAQLTLLTGIFLSLSVFAQGTAAIHGTVNDETGAALPGVSIKIKGTTTGTVSDVSGHFTLNAAIGQTLSFSFIGYKTTEVAIQNLTPITVKLTPSSSSLNEVVVVGYTTQKKGSLTSAVSQISGSEITTTKNENIVNTLTGKVPGLRVVQNTSEPGSFNNSFDIRGMGSPLIVVDGIPRPDLARIDPNDVESISVLKDASAAVYGVRAANGVILVTTKKGKKGKMELNYTGTFGWQVPSKFPSSVNAVDYMTLVNEQSMHNANGGHLTYTDADFEAYQNGTKQSTDWHAATVNKSAPQMEQNLSASGGSDNSTYFVSLGMTGQDGILKSNDLDYKKYNLRSNLSTRVTKNLKFDLNVSGTMEEKNQPYQSPYWIFRSMWYQPPTNPVYANNNPLYLNNLPNPLHPVAQADADVSGYQQYNNKWFQSAASLTYDIPFVKGLNVKALYSFDDVINDNKKYNKAYYLYTYNGATDTYAPSLNQSPSTIRREYYEYPTDLARFSINYDHSFGGVHNVSALLLYEESTRNADNFYAQRELSIPVDQLFAGNSLNQQGNMSTGQLYTYKNAAYVGDLSYDYKSKYLAKFAFRYDGSSRFGTDKQWGFFPDVELGWRISEENFWKNSSTLSFINNLKIRGSYGITGDDSASAYQFEGGYSYPASGSATGQPPGAVFDGTFINGVQNKGIPNPNITWYTSKTFDGGIDIEGWNGLIDVTFDYFIRNRSGLLATQLLTLPDVVGASLPQQNLNGDRTQGFDFEITHRNHIGKLAYNVRATFGMTNTMNTTQVQAQAGNSYLNWLNGTANRNNNVYFGYGSSGQYQSYKDIENSDQFTSRSVVVGDYKYEDWNGDGQVDVSDSHPIATTGLPLITYGFNLGGSYQNFDFNFLFQGAAMVNASYLEQLSTPLWAGGNALSQFLDRWHPADPKADPYSPSTVWVPGYYSYTGTVAYTNTLENLHSAAYLRLKSAEIGYSLPEKWMGRTGIRGVRIFANGYNLLTFTNLKYLDPEHPSAVSAVDQQYGYAYPLDKIYSFGVNVKF
ncbi:MAG TPA: TonB-dependent receptor [Mucilaginibacter sp.]|nr:TonB-dependent receptor [Mucilaginibacter sp.]